MSYGSVLSAEQDPPELRKERGAFFTPGSLADFVCEHIIGSPATRVFEPSCGEAEFLRAAADRLCELGAARSSVGNQLYGCELHSLSAEAAECKLRDLGVSCSITVGDFLSLSPCNLVDVVVGNPPYVRFQVIDEVVKRSIRGIAERTGVTISPLASLWVPFLLHSCDYLKVGGSLGMVLPAELLTVRYAAPVRKFLLHQFSRVELYTFEKRVFPEVQEEVLLLFACGYRQGSSTSISWFQCADVEDARRCLPSTYAPRDVDDRWADGLIAQEPRDILAGLVEDELLVPLESWGKVSLGAVTGSNDYFALSADDVRRYGLSQHDTVRLCPPGSGHLRLLSFSEEDWRQLETDGKKTYLLYPDGEPSEGVRRYLDEGVRTGVSERYKCRKRSPWWRVPSVGVPDAFLTYMNAYGPNIVENGARVVNLNSCHGIRFNEDVRELGQRLLPLAAFNPASLLSAELVGRSYGGGVLKLEQREAASWLVPSSQAIEEQRCGLESIREDVDTLLRKKRYEDASHLLRSAFLDL